MSFENIVGKGEIANEQFILFIPFPTLFSTYLDNCTLILYDNLNE